MNKDPDTNLRVILFARTPLPGQVKTRLARHIGAESTLALYSCFLTDMLEKILHAGLVPRICYFPPESRSEMERLLGSRFDYFPQTGPDLGEKMLNAFADTFSAGFQKAILVGSDFPDLPDHFLAEAADRLDDHDCVIGPAADGGYYLIGFKQNTFYPAVFTGIPWSTDTVYARTRGILEKAGKKIHALGVWQDIDDWPDLAGFIENQTRGGADAPQTIQCLKKLKLMESK